MAHFVWEDMSGRPLPEKEARGPYLVYSHVCPVNGKTYIGITRRNELERWENGKAYQDNPAFYADIEKYGWENFIHRIEIRGLTETDALVLESVLISLHRTLDPRCGYNRAEFGTKGWQPTDEQRAMLSEKKKAYLQAHPEAAAAFTEARRGVSPPEEVREKISAALSGVPKTEAHKKNISLGIARAGRSRPVRCAETGEEYPSAWEAKKLTGVSDAGIGRCCRGEQKTAGGFHWEYV